MKNKLSVSALTERLQAAAELLESIASNRELLAGVSEAERTRLLQAAGRISRPDARARRQLVKISKRQRKAEKSQRAETALNKTGIRKLRRQTVFTTPNVFPTNLFHPDINRTRPGIPRGRRATKLLHLQTGLFDDPPFLRPALPQVRGIEFFQTHRNGGFARARGTAHRRACENRLSSRNKTSARRSAFDCQHKIPARLGSALFARAGFWRMEGSSGNFWIGFAPHAER